MNRRYFLQSMGSSLAVSTFGIETATQIAQADTTSSWTHPRHDTTRDGYAPNNRVPTQDFREDWRVAEGSARTPVIDNGTVYVNSSYTLHAVDEEAGREQWKFDFNETIGAPAIDNNYVYVTTGVFKDWKNIEHYYLYAINRDEGNKKWRFEGNGFLGWEPAVTSSSVYVGSEDNELYSISIESGEIEWSMSTEHTVWSPAVSDGTVYASASAENKLYALDATTGNQKWNFTTSNWIGAPVISDNTVYIPCADSNVYAVDAESGEELWRFNTAADSLPGDFAVANQNLFVANGNGGIVAVDKRSGDEVWSYSANGEILVPPSVASNRVIISESTGLVTLDVEDGNPLRLWQPSADLFDPPAVANQTIYLPKSDGITALTGDIADKPKEPNLNIDIEFDQPTISPRETTTATFEITNSGGPINNQMIFYVDDLLQLVPENWDITDYTATQGTWDTYSWSFGQLNNDQTVTGSVTIQIGADVKADEYTVIASIGAFDQPVAKETATLTIKSEEPLNRVEDVDGEPVPGATVRLFGKGPYSEPDSQGRLIAERTTDENGEFDLPTTFTEEDQELVVVAERGDWFTTQAFRTEEISSSEYWQNFGAFTLDRQLLSGPSVARDSSGDPFGTVTVWRYHHADEIDIFYTEVTNNSIVSEPWNIVGDTGAVNGPIGGNFLFSYPEEIATTAEDTAFSDVDPTGSGNVQVFATHPQGHVRDPDDDGLGIPDILKPSTSGYFHPMQSHSGLPLYETTKRLGTFAELKEDFDNAGWHPLTPESSQRADEIEQRINEGLDFPLNACDLLANSGCGIGFLLDVLDTLTWVNKLLDGERRIAAVNQTPHTPIAGGAKPATEFDVWRADNPAPFDKSYEASVVHQVPIRTNSDQVTYSVQTEWGRPYNNRGQFSATFSTGPLDIEISSTEGEDDWLPGTTRTIDITVKNRSLQTRTISQIELSALGRDQSAEPRAKLEPGESRTLPALFAVTPETAGTMAVEARAVDDTQTTISRINKFDVSVDISNPSIGISPANPTTGTEVTFTAEGVDDSDVSAYEWDFDDDPTFEANGKSTTLSFDEPGDYSVQLRVRGVDGAVSITSRPITVQPSDTIEYDDDNNGDISLTELSDAASDYANGKITLSELAEIAATYANS